MGEILADEHPAQADVVIPVPDSAIPAAVGYARRSGIPFREGLIKNRYIGRTFIQPSQALREHSVALKYNALRDVLDGKRVVVVDDSIVRGSTSGPIVALLRRYGAREVHMRVCSPPIRHQCFFGVDMARRDDLIASKLDIEGIRRHVGADSLGYLSLEGMVAATGATAGGLCTACFTGDYLVPVQLELGKDVLEAESLAASAPVRS
jgi:amidophosphoribosyltransferase